MSRRATDGLRWMAIAIGAQASVGTELGLQTALVDTPIRAMAGVGP
jgi:hypothetical protein